MCRRRLFIFPWVNHFNTWEQTIPPELLILMTVMSVVGRGSIKRQGEGGGVHVRPFSHGHESVLHCEQSSVPCLCCQCRAPRSGPQNLTIRHSWLCHPDNGETWPPSIPPLPPLNASVYDQNGGAMSRQAGCVTGRQRQRARWMSSGCVAYATNDTRARTAYNHRVRTFFRVRHIVASIKASGKL